VNGAAESARTVETRQCRIPPAALSDPESVEIMRAWIVNNGLDVTFMLPWEEPDNWGILLVDIARHAARAYAEEGRCSENEALARIKALFDAEWDQATDHGTTEALNTQ
jgi:hypothetical protein